VVFPELLGSVLASNTLQNLLATGMVILKLRHIVDVAVHNEVQAVGLVMRRNVADCECLGHGYV
jgi:hypothetical protein